MAKWDQAGAYLRGLRTNIGLKQSPVAERLGFPYPTVLDVIERGSARLPPDKWEPLAKILGVEPAEFTANLREFYDNP